MQSSFRFEEDASFLIITMAGELSYPGLKALLSDIFAHPDYAEKDQFTIVDLSAVTQVDFGFRQMLGFVEWAKSTRKIDGPYNPGAVLAPGDAVFGMLRMYDQLGQNTLGYALNICRSREELARALGRSMTDLNRLCGWDGDARTKIVQ